MNKARPPFEMGISNNVRKDKMGREKVSVPIYTNACLVLQA